MIRELERDGWHLDRQVGSHRQYGHPTKAGTVTTVPGNLGGDLAAKLASIRRQAGRRRDR